MSLVPIIGGGLWMPSYYPTAWATGTTTYVIDATGEKAVLVCLAPKTGNIDRFDFNIASVTNSPDNGLRASLQGVDLTTGQNNGTILGATNNAFVLYAHTVTAGWKSTNFGEVAAVTRGQLLACVLDLPTFVASDSLALTSLNLNTNACGLPYGLSVLGTKVVTQLPLLALHYTDGYAPVSPWLPGLNALANLTYNSGSALGDEFGLAFKIAVPCKLNAVGLTITVVAGADFELVVYDAANNILSTTAHDGDVTGLTTQAGFTIPLQTEIELAANTLYRITVRPTTANNVSMQYMTFASLDLMDTAEGGRDWYMTSQLNQGGTWTDYNTTGQFRRPHLSLNLTALGHDEDRVWLYRPGVHIRR